jgi:DNA-binding GntR family transcriptional regulator
MDLKVSPNTTQQLSVKKLRQAILAGLFKPGDRLIEADLCRMLGVSRPSVREALRSLEAERLVVIIPNKGPQIPIISWDQAEQIYQVRALLEGEAAALSAQRVGAEDLSVMRQALKDFARSVRSEDAEGRVDATARFYDVILNSCGNAVICEILQGLHARVNFLRWRSMSRPGRAKFSLRELKDILQALEDHDAVAARAAAVKHTEMARRAAKEAYENVESPSRLRAAG